jgi:peptide/nickel transport system permease protein
VIRYAARRLVGAVPLVLGIATLVFLILNIAPGDPASYLISPGMSQEVVERIRADFGLDQPLHTRYLQWMGAVLAGDLGHSFSHGMPVTEVLLGALPSTLLLSGIALVLAFGAGIFLGVVQAVRQHSALDSTLSVLALFFYSMPPFWLALMLMLVFSYMAANVWHLPFWFPASGMESPTYDSLSLMGRLGDRAAHLVLPATTLTLVLTAGIARYVRGSMLEVIRQDFVRTARAKGLPEVSVIWRHALRNGLIPVVTLAGLYLPILFSGTVFIEEVFAWPGMGRALVGAIQARDYPLVMGGALLFSSLVVLGNLLADLLYAVVDPRVRYE